MKKNKKGFAIIVGIGLTLVLSLTTYIILDYIIPYAKNVKGIENSTNAYYQSYAGVEKSLKFVKDRTLINQETQLSLLTGAVSYGYKTFSSGTIIPQLGEGNSEFDKNFNVLGLNSPIELEVGNGFQNSWGGVNFLFRIPDLDKDGDIGDELSLSGTNLPIVNWMLTSKNDSLIANKTYLTSNDIDSFKQSGIDFFSSSNNHDKGINLSALEVTYQNFYDSNCKSSGSGCILKIFLVNELALQDGTKIPYLEYKITGFDNGFPDRYTKIESTGKSYGFKKDLKVKIPQQTVNSALDFTVFQ